jgi:hypothetical protein
MKTYQIKGGTLERYKIPCPDCELTHDVCLKSFLRFKLGRTSGRCATCRNRRTTLHRKAYDFAKIANIRRRFEKSIVVQKNGCWLWSGYKNADGYGVMGIGRKVIKAHRVAYMIYKGEIPEGMNVCHTCDVPSCVNPEHLWIGTQKENVLDMCLKKRHVPSSSKGESHSQAKLSEEQVKLIRTMYTNLKISHASLSEQFGVSRGQIGHIISRKSWSHI